MTTLDKQALEKAKRQGRIDGMKEAHAFLKARAFEVASATGMEQFNAFTIAEWCLELRKAIKEAEARDV